jgi:hypothetical protein
MAVKRVTEVKFLSEQEWRKLRDGITRYIDQLRGKSIVEWVVFLNEKKIKCNSDLLRGLCSDLHQWKEPQSDK